ncbi:MAG: DUF4177 domain-containing protein [candidate division WOR-3 bacterium]
MKKWEYKFVWIDIHMSPVLLMARWGVQVPGESKARSSMEGVEQYVTELGAQGWELVSVINGTNQDGIITKAILFFKRPVIEAVAPEA